MSRHAARIGRLTIHQHVVLALVADGLTDQAIASRLGITRNSAHAHVQHALKALGAHSRAQAVAIAMRGGELT